MQRAKLGYLLTRSCTHLALLRLANSFGSTIKFLFLGFTRLGEKIMPSFNISQQYKGMNAIGFQYSILLEYQYFFDSQYFIVLDTFFIGAPSDTYLVFYTNTEAIVQIWRSINLSNILLGGFVYISCANWSQLPRASASSSIHFKQPNATTILLHFGKTFHKILQYSTIHSSIDDEIAKLPVRHLHRNAA